MNATTPTQPRPAEPSDRERQRRARWRWAGIFWSVLLGFLLIDTARSYPLDWSMDAPPIALGTGGAGESGGHCSAAPRAGSAP